ncbi:MAG: HEAT repeat domain-containing protein [bacterium]
MSKQKDISPRKGGDKISQTLVKRRGINEIIDSLSAKDYSIKTMERKVKELLKMGEEVLPTLIKRLEDPNERVVSFSCFALERCRDERTVDLLLKAMENPRIEDTTKIAIASILLDMGVELSQEEVMSHVQKPQELFQKSVRGILKALKEENVFAVDLIKQSRNQPPEALASLIENLSQFQDPSVLPFLKITIRSEHLPVIEASAKALGRLEIPQSAAVLREALEEWEDKLKACRTEDREFRRPIEDALRRLKFSGVDVEGAAAYPAEPIYKSVVTPIDGMGSQGIWVARSLGKNKVSYINVLVNDTVGIKDSFGEKEVSRRKFDRVMKYMEEDLGYFEVDLEYCQRAVWEAEQLNWASKRPIPPEYYIFKDILGDIRRAPPIEYSWAEIFDPEEISQDEELLLDSVDINDWPEFENWFFDEPAVFDYGERALKLTKRYKDPESDAYQRKATELLAEMEERFVDAEFRQRLKHRLMKMADLLTRDGEDEDDIAMILAAALTLDKPNSELPWGYHPFIYGMLSNSVEFAIQNLEMGIDWRKNPELYYEAHAYDYGYEDEEDEE